MICSLRYYVTYLSNLNMYNTCVIDKSKTVISILLKNQIKTKEGGFIFTQYW